MKKASDGKVIGTNWFDSADTDAFVKSKDPLPLLFNWEQSNAGSKYFLAVGVLNRTGVSLPLEEVLTVDGEAWAWPATPIDPTPDELGTGSGSVGLWLFQPDSSVFRSNPSVVIKFSAIPETGNQPVYVGADFSVTDRDHYTTSARNGAHGSAQDYYDKFVKAGGADSDYDKRIANDGCVYAWGAYRETILYDLGNPSGDKDHAYVTIAQIVSTI